jgi:SSS family solute:Na+ symporter
VGLVYSLTERPSEGGVPWYQRPAYLAVLVLVLGFVLNMIFR